MYAGGGYRLGNYDRSGRETSSVVGKQSAGNTSLKFLYDVADESLEDEESDESLEDESKAISSKITGSGHISVSNHYGRIDHSGPANNAGGAGGALMQEFSGNHKNTIRKGISPYKQPKHSGPPLGGGGSSQAFRTTGNKIDLGSRKGWSRPYYNTKQGDQKRYFSLKSLVQDTHDGFSQFVKQKNKVKKIINEISN